MSALGKAKRDRQLFAPVRSASSKCRVDDLPSLVMLLLNSVPTKILDAMPVSLKMPNTIAAKGKPVIPDTTIRS